MDSFRQRLSLLAVFGATFVLSTGCSSSEPTGPLNPALTGEWIAPNLDTSTQLSLAERGDAVIGTVAFQSVVGRSTFAVAGTSAQSDVSLRWFVGIAKETFTGTLSADQQSLTGTIMPGAEIVTFHRQRPISGSATR